MSHWCPFVESIHGNTSVFEKPAELKKKVMSIINASKSLKDSIVSLRESLSHLSSLIQAQETIRNSLVKGETNGKDSILGLGKSSIVKSIRSNFDEDDVSCAVVSSDCSYHATIIQNNICKLKRDISYKIMTNQHLKRTVYKYPHHNFFKNLHQAFRVQSVKGESAGSSIISLFTKNNDTSDYEPNLNEVEVLERIESNISSLIPSYENTSIFDEKSSSFKMPNFQNRNYIRDASKMDLRNKELDQVKNKLEFDSQRTKFLQSLCSSQKKSQNLFNYDPISDLKELDIASTDTARFGAKKSRRKEHKLFKSQNFSTTQAYMKLSCKKNFYKIKPKVSPCKKKTKKKKQ